MKITNDIFLLGGADIDSNVYCIANELLVDCGSGMFFGDIIEQMKRMAIKLSGVSTIVLTHSHAEHSGGASLFLKKMQAKLLVHPEGVESLKDNESARALELDYSPPRVDGTLVDGSVVRAGPYSFKVLHTPGHSIDSLCLWEEAKRILISGDTLLTSEENEPAEPEDMETLAESQRKLGALGIETLLPGHGAPASNSNPYGRNVIKDILSKIQ